jgi:hypothetical protein
MRAAIRRAIDVPPHFGTATPAAASVDAALHNPLTASPGIEFNRTGLFSRCGVIRLKPLLLSFHPGTGFRVQTGVVPCPEIKPIHETRYRENSLSMRLKPFKLARMNY